MSALFSASIPLLTFSLLILSIIRRGMLQFPTIIRSLSMCQISSDSYTLYIWQLLLFGSCTLKLLHCLGELVL